MRKAFLFGVFLLLLGFAGSAAGQGVVFQKVPFASTPQPVGSGARAVAWGSAFIAIADDATAASWNPGGLVQLVLPEASVALSYHARSEQLDFKGSSGFSSDSESRSLSAAALNYASAVYPFHVSDVNMVVSLNYQRLYEFDRNLDYQVTGPDQINPGNLIKEDRTLEQLGALTTVTPAFCVQILPQWSLGLSVNFWGLDSAGNGWEQQWQVENRSVDPNTGLISSRSWSEVREEYKLRGVNYVIGTHYKIQNWTLAAVYKSSWEADVDYDAVYETAQVFPLNPAANTYNRMKLSEDEKLVWPESYGLGAAYRYSDRLSFAIDVYTTNWSRYKLKTDSGDLNLLSGDDQSKKPKNTWQAHAGAEYLWILPKYVFALRGGIFYDPEPLQDRVNEFYGAAIGGGMVYKNYVIDAAVQYKWGTDLKSERVQNIEAEADAQDLFMLVSLIYHFQ